MIVVNREYQLSQMFYGQDVALHYEQEKFATKLEQALYEIVRRQGKIKLVVSFLPCEQFGMPMVNVINVPVEELILESGNYFLGPGASGVRQLRVKSEDVILNSSDGLYVENLFVDYYNTSYDPVSLQTFSITNLHLNLYGQNVDLRNKFNCENLYLETTGNHGQVYVTLDRVENVFYNPDSIILVYPKRRRMI